MFYQNDLQTLTLCYIFTGKHLKAASEYIADVEFSPLLGGFVAVLSGGRGFFLTAPNAKFDRQVCLLLLYI